MSILTSSLFNHLMQLKTALAVLRDIRVIYQQRRLQALFSTPIFNPSPAAFYTISTPILHAHIKSHMEFHATLIFRITCMYRLMWIFGGFRGLS